MFVIPFCTTVKKVFSSSKLLRCQCTKEGRGSFELTTWDVIVSICTEIGMTLVATVTISLLPLPLQCFLRSVLLFLYIYINRLICSLRVLFCYHYFVSSIQLLLLFPASLLNFCSYDSCSKLMLLPFRLCCVGAESGQSCECSWWWSRCR